MEIYNNVRTVPEEAKKPIKGGRLAGMTDINPQWRIQMLTEIFGMCGFGWYYEVTDKWTETANNEVCAFVSINLFVKADDTWSFPIHGTGGSKLATMEKSGMYVSDECYKMATTDAISVACKQLGFGADVYWQSGRSKYSQGVDEMQPLPKVQESKEPKQEPKKQTTEPKEEPSIEDVPAKVGTTREDMIRCCKAHYPGDKMQSLCNCFKISKIEDASTAQLLAIWNKYGAKA